MIIYGSGSALLKSTVSKTSTCPNCEAKGTMELSIFSRHAHVFWIPLFPFGKTGGAHCQSCEHSLKQKKMPEGMKREYQDLKDETRPKIWQFSGLGIIVVLILWAVVASGQNKKKELEYLSEPLAGDIYEYETETGNFSTYKVLEPFNDSLLLVANNYETDGKSGISEIDVDSNYTDLFYVFSLAEIQEMYEEETLYEVNR